MNGHGLYYSVWFLLEDSRYKKTGRLGLFLIKRLVEMSDLFDASKMSPHDVVFGSIIDLGGT